MNSCFLCQLWPSKKITTHPDIAHPRQSPWPTMKGIPTYSLLVKVFSGCVPVRCVEASLETLLGYFFFQKNWPFAKKILLANLQPWEGEEQKLRIEKNSPKNLPYQKWTWLRIGPGLLGNHPIWKMFGWVPYNPVYVQLSEGHWKMYLWLERWHHFGYLFGRFQPFLSPCSLPHLSGRKKLLSRGAGRGLSKVTSSGIWRCSGSTSPTT